MGGLSSKEIKNRINQGVNDAVNKFNNGANDVINNGKNTITNYGNSVASTARYEITKIYDASITNLNNSSNTIK